MENKYIFALGFFDGVHLGHQALLRACCSLAQRHSSEPGAVTFDTHPDKLVNGQTPLLLNTVQERQRCLLGFGMHRVLELPFDEKMMAMPWQDFLDMLVDHHAAAGFVCGDDFRFGHGGQGDAGRLADYCRQRELPWAVVPEQKLNGIRVSSSHIRSLIEAGDMETAAAFLGHHHYFSGNVVAGRHIGRTIGVPTANLLFLPQIVVPRCGVYASECVVEGVRYAAVTNIGSRPTVEGHQLRAESWLLDFEGDLYGKHMVVLLRKFIRPEQRFDSLEALKAQIRRDAAAAAELTD